MKSSEYFALVSKRLHENRISGVDWRVGQTYFNVLHEVNPKLANIVRGSGVDCFYQDRLVPVFCEFVATKW